MDEAVNNFITPPSSLEIAKTSSLPSFSSTSQLKPASMMDDVVRHCGFCLQVCGSPIKRCGGCKRRAYCSKECQVKDWSVSGTGQRHKNWCGLHEYGEEDVDWEVVPVPDKGLGIIAKRLLPAGYRIIVEPIFLDPHGHPAINDLEPKEVSLERKFALNLIERDGATNIPGEKNFLCLRISRVNHNCRPNAAWSYDDVAQVAILYALQEIQPGEEICRAYVSFARLDLGRPHAGNVPPEFEFTLFKAKLMPHLSTILREVCPGDCFCKNPGAKKLVLEVRRLNDEMKSLPPGRSYTEGAIKARQKRLEIERRLNLSWSFIAQWDCELFHLLKKETLIKDAIQIYKIIQPYSKLIEKYEKLLGHPPEVDKCHLKLAKEKSYVTMSAENEEAEKLLKKLTLYEPIQIRSPSESQPREDSSAIRHCAACLQLCKPPVKTCGGCKKRAYCSEECQTADWKVHGTGQGHENWCGRFDYGEEDIEWKVVPVENKGLGVVAIKLLPAAYKIIVEAVFTNPHDHPGIADLEPKGASLAAKFQLNSVAGDEDRDNGKNIVGLRISRVNHDCKPNASRIYDDGARVDILFALRDIQPGEEICVAYCSFARMDLARPTAHLMPPEKEFSIYPQSLKLGWNIVCPDNCYCKDADARKLVMEGRLLNEKIQFLIHSYSDSYGCLLAGGELLDIHHKLNLSWTQPALTNLGLFQICVMKEDTMYYADQHIQATPT